MLSVFELIDRYVSQAGKKFSIRQLPCLPVERPNVVRKFSLKVKRSESEDKIQIFLAYTVSKSRLTCISAFLLKTLLPLHNDPLVSTALMLLSTVRTSLKLLVSTSCFHCYQHENLSNVSIWELVYN
jgi:hypothetical protein